MHVAHRAERLACTRSFGRRHGLSKDEVYRRRGKQVVDAVVRERVSRVIWPAKGENASRTYRFYGLDSLGLLPVRVEDAPYQSVFFTAIHKIAGQRQSP